ncbi:MAG: 50S ribosomal protein L25 [Verrucomicrobiota bacterium]
MAEQSTLQAEKRELKGSSSSRRLRREGKVPAVVYGSKQREYMIQVDSQEFFRVYRDQSSSNFLLNLEIDGAQEKTKLAFVQDIQRDPLSGGFIHIDFRAVQDDEIITASVPITLEGEPAGVKAGGLLEQMVKSLEIHCKPADLPERITHDISEVNVGEVVKISDLQFPEGVSAKLDGEVLVALINKSRASIAAAAAGGEEGE